MYVGMGACLYAFFFFMYTYVPPTGFYCLVRVLTQKQSGVLT